MAQSATMTQSVFLMSARLDLQVLLAIKNIHLLVLTGSHPDGLCLPKKGLLLQGKQHILWICLPTYSRRMQRVAQPLLIFVYSVTTNLSRAGPCNRTVHTGCQVIWDVSCRVGMVGMVMSTSTPETSATVSNAIEFVQQHWLTTCLSDA